jgi:hypothetical protein
VPARKTPFLDQRVREKIQASMIIRALNDCVAGRNKMTSVQVRAAEVLLRKVVPDLAAVEHSGEATVQYVISSEPMSAEDWKRVEAENSPPLLEAAKNISRS